MNYISTIKITVKSVSILDLKAGDFHIEFPKLVNGVTEISKQPIKDIKIEGNVITLVFDAFVYNQKFNIVCNSKSELNFDKDNILRNTSEKHIVL